MKISKNKIKIISLKSYVFGLLFFLSLVTSCETTEPPSNQNITLTAEDASCTEAWLNLKLDNISLPTEIKLMQNDSIVSVSNINSSDTTLFVKNLLPSQAYTFQATSIQQQVSSNKVSVTTMDTTSHNFTWETFTIGNMGTLRDVAIINENNIWAVGEIYVNDSTGKSQLHNAAHWNGNKWEIIGIPTKIWNTNSFINGALRGVLAFNENNVFVTTGGQVIHYNGAEWGEWTFLFDDLSDTTFGTANKFWGVNENDIWVVGNIGAIFHFNGTTWQKLASNTEVDLLDVWGSENGRVVWACGYDSDNSRTVLLRIENGDVKIMYEGDSYGENNGYGIGLFGGLYGKRDNLFLMNTGWIFKQRNENRLNVRFVTDITTWGYSIDGNDVNDIFVSGQQGLVGHYNGYSYKEYEEFKRNYLYLYSIDVQQKTTAIVGVQHLGAGQSNCIIIIGK